VSAAQKPSDDDVTIEPDGPDLPVVAKKTEQFPATDGTKEGRATEVEQRSADGAAGTRYVKEFVTEPGAEHNEPMHEANKAGVLQEAIQRGLHPRGEARFDGAEVHTTESGPRVFRHAVLTYSVEVIPASVDTRPTETTTPRDQIESDDGDTATPKDKPAAGATRRAEAERAKKAEPAKTSTAKKE
jgi:hypothetical protein